jgi:predicted dehydrogenase
MSDIHLLCIVTPPHLHREFSEAALAAGKHVLCEKPMAMDATQALSMCRDARESGRLALIDHELRFAPSLMKMRRLMQEGYLGTPLHVQLQMRTGRRLDPRRPFDWWSDASRGGGALGAIGSHALDWLRWMFGDIASVSGVLGTAIETRTPPGELRPRRVDADDHASFLVRFVAPRPAHAAVLLSAVAHRGGGSRFEIFGSEGILLHDDEGHLWGSRRDPAARAENEQAPLEELDEVESLSESERKQLPDTLWARSFAHLARELVPAVAEDRDELPNAADFETGLAVQRALDAVRLAARTGAWIAVPAGPDAG